MGVGTDLPRAILLYALLTVIFLSSAMIFLPVGQLCGRLLERRGKLRAYGLNLLGSLVGVVLMLLASSLWTQPPVWFAACFLGLLLFFNPRESRSLVVGLVMSFAGMMILAWWPIAPMWNKIYSPYQLLEIGVDKDSGLTTIRAAGHYYQRILNLSGKNLSGQMAKNRDYYDLPYTAHPGVSDVAVVGSGTGNDVAAALRAGAARVDAVEIDPAILMAGVNNHPEKPYSDPRTVAINDDARSFLRRTNRMYDLIVYGLLDSHTLLSHGSSVRLDSFVYTIEGLREARNRLKADGLLSLSFTFMSDAHRRKVNLMLQQVFDGRLPTCVGGEYDGSVVCLASNDPKWTLPSKVLEQTGFSELTAHSMNPAVRVDVSTDDWPFFYMPQRIYPVSYLIMIVLILTLSVSFVGNFMEEAPRFSHLSFFFLGAGFMLVETKGITEMGLTFGNTWQVVGIVIAGILIMAFLGNCAVYWLKIQRPLVPYLLLWFTLAVGWVVSRSGGFPSTPLGRIGTVVILTCPLLFSGIVFSTLLSTRGQVSGIMAANLLGAICGGLLEYNSMYFGFRSLYVIALALYMAAFVSELPLVSRSARLREA
jgi:spermidine synthase